MLYEDEDLPKGSGAKPYIYSNFVSTLDGKVQVLENWKSYWPIGSKTDHRVLTELRALSDVLIHGSGTAKLSPFVTKVQTPSLIKLRKSLGKSVLLPYVVLSNKPDSKLVLHLKNYAGGKAYLITNSQANIPKGSESFVNLIRIGEKEIDLKKLLSFLSQKLGARRILMEGGPTLFGSFLEEDLIDEVFLTIAPKIVGGESNKTLTLVENKLFTPENIKRLKTISVKQISDEVFLRYKVTD